MSCSTNQQVFYFRKLKHYFSLELLKEKKKDSTPNCVELYDKSTEINNMQLLPASGEGYIFLQLPAKCVFSGFNAVLQEKEASVLFDSIFNSIKNDKIVKIIK